MEIKKLFLGILVLLVGVLSHYPKLAFPKAENENAVFLQEGQTTTLTEKNNTKSGETSDNKENTNDFAIIKNNSSLSGTVFSLVLEPNLFLLFTYEWLFKPEEKQLRAVFPFLVDPQFHAMVCFSIPKNAP